MCLFRSITPGKRWWETVWRFLLTAACALLVEMAGTGAAHACTHYASPQGGGSGHSRSAPFWPWPMDARIFNATRKVGGTGVNVTVAIESMFGPIPTACKGAALPPSGGN